MKKFLLPVFLLAFSALAVRPSHSQTVFDDGFTIGGLAEIKTYGDDFGYGGETDLILPRFTLGLSYTYSSEAALVNASSNRILDYSFKNNAFSLNANYRFGRTKNWEAGLVYSFMQSQSEYLDLYSGHYKYQYIGDIDMHFVGVVIGYRYYASSGFYIRPALRFAARMAMVEHPEYKLTEFYNGYTAIESDNVFLTYATIKFALGYVISMKKNQPTD